MTIIPRKRKIREYEDRINGNLNKNDCKRSKEKGEQTYARDNYFLIHHISQIWHQLTLSFTEIWGKGWRKFGSNIETIAQTDSDFKDLGQSCYLGVDRQLEKC